jgi:fructose/tagatose bisphosphate aldolase
MGIDAKNFHRALEVGRPPNVRKLFPNSKALLVSGKVVDRAMRAQGKAMTIAANARNRLVINGVLRAAQRANAAVIIEIAKSEGGAGAYCAVNYWNMATYVDATANELGITVPVAIHADHYGIKGVKDVESARIEIPSMFEAGLTSIAIDASHLPDDENLLANLDLNKYIPAWAGYETEVGEIKGKEGLSTKEEALFLVRGLNAHGISPDWIALNNGTTHGIEASEAGIQVELTAGIHQALEPYRLSGAQHGTSGNSSERLRRIAKETSTTKANVATALQMISWGVKVNDYGNAELDAEKRLVKVPGAGVTEELWAEMVAYGAEKKWKAGDFKSINLPFENKVMRQPAEIRERSIRAVEEFVYNMLTSVFYATDTADLGVEAILKAGSFDLGPKAERVEQAAEWTPDRIRERAKTIGADKGAAGNFDD